MKNHLIIVIPCTCIDGSTCTWYWKSLAAAKIELVVSYNLLPFLLLLLQIYCSVLIVKGSKSLHTQDDMMDLAPPTSCSEDEVETDEGKVPLVESHGDIIQFYNKVFIEQLKDFVLKFSEEVGVVCCDE